MPPFTTGEAFREPPSISSVNKRLRFTMVAKNGTITVGGLQIGNAQSYTVAGSPAGLLGPTLRVNPGDEIDIVLDNQLVQPEVTPAPSGTHDPCMHDTGIKPGDPQPTNLHFHGLHVTPRDHREGGVTYYGDNVLACMKAGPHHVRFRIPHDHDLGTFWYHAHMHGLTDDQVYRGLAGMLIIGDGRKYLPERFRKVQTRLISLKDMQAVPTPAGWQIPDPNHHDWLQPTTRTVNGLVMPKLTMKPGETQLWQLANSSSALWYDVTLTNRNFTIVARDGNRLIAPQKVSDLVLAPGERFDVLVTAPKKLDTLKLSTQPWDQGRPGNNGTMTFPGADLATVSVSGAAASAISAPTPSGELPTFPTKRGTARTWIFSITSKGFLINGNTFDPDRIDAKPKLGTTERWTLINESSEYHPIHIHQDDFRVISVNGSRVSFKSDQDIVLLPPAAGGAPGKVVLDMPFQTYWGNYVMHCHILDHEDGGMMARISVQR
jgi:FtsP/CotA-like multicopper oxidase with cupredoxin domain